MSGIDGIYILGIWAYQGVAHGRTSNWGLGAALYRECARCTDIRSHRKTMQTPSNALNFESNSNLGRGIIGTINAGTIDIFIFAIIWAVAIGGVEGWLFSLKNKGFGLVGNMFTAIMGAFFGFLVLRFLVGAFTRDGLIYGIAALAGAIIGGQITLRVSRRSLNKAAP